MLRKKFVYLQQEIPPREPKGSVPWRAFCFYMAIYRKLALGIDGIIALLRDRGLIIKNEDEAKDQLEIISYFRLAAYLRPMEANKASHVYKPGSTFENAVDLYYFDKSLRNLIFSAVQSIEVAVRSKIINKVSLAHGPFWFAEPSLAIDSIAFNDNLSSIRREIARSKEEFINSHKSKYDTPSFPPAWKSLEVSSFGTISKLLGNLNDKSLKKAIARDLNLPKPDYLVSWVKCATILRNCVAHHSMVWNRNYSTVPVMPTYLPAAWITMVPQAPDHKLYSQLCCLLYLQNAIHPDNHFVRDFKALLAEHPNVDTAAIGFPAGWEDEPLWS